MPLNADEKKELLRIARETLKTYIISGKMPVAATTSESLKVSCDAFVTLRKRNHELRGCIGTVRVPRPLFQNVAELSVSSAMRDPRFAPLTAQELDDLVIEISVLSPFEKVENVSDIIAGVHGVLLEHGGRSGIFLPQVATEQGWGTEELLSQLCSHKAGLPSDAWKKGAALYSFTVEHFEEEDKENNEKAQS